jgi:hypothetical protein
VAAPVLLISSDPFLGASLEAVARGRLQVARLDPSRRRWSGPGGPAAGTVVLDVTARQREVLRAWVRHHHAGPLVVLLKPAERVPSPAARPDQVVIGRPFRLGDLVRCSRTLRPPGRTAPKPDPPRSAGLGRARTRPTGSWGPCTGG